MCTVNTLENIMKSVVAESKGIFGEKLSSVILYGSYARKDYDEESDVDVMIIADIPTEDVNFYEKKLESFALKTDLENDIVLSLMIQDKATFDRWKETSAFFKNIVREGIEYAA